MQSGSLQTSTAPHRTDRFSLQCSPNELRRTAINRYGRHGIKTIFKLAAVAAGNNKTLPERTPRIGSAAESLRLREKPIFVWCWDNGIKAQVSSSRDVSGASRFVGVDGQGFVAGEVHVALDG
jgi:hypothetical protein